MVRLPIVNSDDGTWGDIIRDFIMKEHLNDDNIATATNGGHKTITIAAGTASAGTAPLKFTSGTLLTTPEVGAIEFNTDTLYFTQTTGVTRTQITTNTGTQTLTNKTLSGTNNTFSNIGPESLATGVSRRVVVTQFGTVSDANYWAKLATFQSPNNYPVATLMLGITSISIQGTAIISVTVRQGTSPTPPDVTVDVVTATASSIIGMDSFKLITGAYGDPVELWMQKKSNWGQFDVYELARSSDFTTLTYNDGAAWQSSAPVGSGNNVVSNGVTAFGVPVVTTTNTQTLTNKTLTSPKVNAILDVTSNVNAFVFSAASGAVNYLQANANIAGYGPQLYASGSDTNISMELIAKGTGVVMANGIEVATISGVQTLTNKAINLASSALTGTVAQFNSALSDGDFATVVTSLTGSSGTVSALSIAPTVTQSSTAGYNVLNITVTESSIGSGAKNLINAQVGGTTVFKVDNTGKIFVGANNANTPTSTPLGIDLGGTFGNNTAGTSGNLKILLYSDSSTKYGFGISNSTLEYQVPDSGNAHRFYVGGAAVATISNTGLDATGLSVGGVPAATTSGTQTLTNKTITGSRVDHLNDTSGNMVIGLYGIPSAVNQYYITNQSVGNYPTIGVDGSDTDIGVVLAPKGSGPVRIYSPSGQTPTIDAAGTDTNLNINLVPKGTGTVQQNGVSVATISGTQTLTNKTLTAPRIDKIVDSAGRDAVVISTTGAAAGEYLNVEAGTDYVSLDATGNSTNVDFYIYPKGAGEVRIWADAGASSVSTIAADGTDTDIDLNLQPKGSGVVKISGTPLMTASGAATLTNKIISGANNTLTALPYDLTAVTFGYVSPRAVGTGDFPFGIKLQRACTLTSVTYRCNTADASGNLVVELRKNGVAVSGSAATIAAANQIAGGTVSGSWSFSTGDILTVYVTAVGTTPGTGLIADITGVTA